MPVSESFSPEELNWAARLAGRLRYAQATFADSPAEERHDCLNSEIQRALKEIVPERRGRHLAALEEHFPTFLDGAPALDSTPRDTSPEELVESLVRIAPDLPPQKLAEFGVKLQQAGYIGLKSSVLADEPPPEFLKLFPIEAGQRVDLQRLYRLAVVLADFFFRLEIFVWTVWQQVAPQTRFRKELGPLNDVRRLGVAYLQADATKPDVSADQIGKVVERTRRLTAGLLGAVGGAGRAFASRFSADYAPDNILALAKTDTSAPPVMFGSRDDARGWWKYKKLFNALTEEVVEERLHQAIAHSAEILIQGTRTEANKPL
jgi:hypothetical protein